MGVPSDWRRASGSAFRRRCAPKCPWKKDPHSGREDAHNLAGETWSAPNKWPAEAELPGFRAFVASYFADMTAIARRLLSLIAASLG